MLNNKGKEAADALKKLKTIEDIEKWCSNPEIHPFNGNHMSPNSNEYQK